MAQKKVAKLLGFRGGLNLVNPGADESPDCLNVTLDEYGDLTRRGSWATAYRMPLGSPSEESFTSAKYVFQWGNALYVQDGVDLKRYSNATTAQPSAAPSTVKTFTTNAKVAAVVFNDKLVVVHPVDGVFESDTAGTTFTNRSTTVKGTCITVWQNKVWVGGDSSFPSRVWRSNAGDAATWTTASDFTDHREVDNTAIVALHGAAGMDVQGRAALLVFKQQSCYRVHDSGTGAFTTLSNSIGAVSAESVDSRYGIVYFISHRGVFATDGDSRPVKISQPIEPWFSRDGFSKLSAADLEKWCLRATRSGFYATVGRKPSISTVFDYLIEYVVVGDPLKGRWFLHQIDTAGAQTGLISMTRGVSGNGEWVWGVHKSGTKLYITGGYASGDGLSLSEAAFSYYWYTPWLELADGDQATLERMLLVGRGANLFVGVERDWVEGTITDYGDQDMTPAATTPLVTKEIHVQADPPARSHRLKFSGSSSAGQGITKPTFAGSTTLSEVAIRNLRLEYTNVER